MLEFAGLGGGGGDEAEVVEGGARGGQVADVLLEEAKLEVRGGQGGVELNGLGEEVGGGGRVGEVAPEDGRELDVDFGVGGVGVEGLAEGLGGLGVAFEGEEGVGDGEVGLGGAGRVGGAVGGAAVTRVGGWWGSARRLVGKVRR